MRTTLDLPEELIKAAMKATNIKVKTKVITIALEDLVRKNKIAKIKDFKGKLDFNLNLDQLRSRNESFGR